VAAAAAVAAAIVEDASLTLSELSSPAGECTGSTRAAWACSTLDRQGFWRMASRKRSATSTHLSGLCIVVYTEPRTAAPHARAPAHRADVTTDAQIVTVPSFVVLRL
jgi:hypothetical protein